MALPKEDEKDEELPVIRPLDPKYKGNRELYLRDVAAMRAQRRKIVRTRPLDRSELLKVRIIATAFKEWQYHFNTGQYADHQGPHEQHPWWEEMLQIIGKEYHDWQEYKMDAASAGAK